MAGAKEHRAFFRNWHTGFFHRRFEVRRRDLGAGSDMAEIDADAADDAVLQRIFVDRRAGLAEMARRVDMRAAVIGHGKKHHGVALDIARIDERLFVRLPDAVDDRRLPRIGRRAVIKFAAQIDDAHRPPLNAALFARRPYSGLKSIATPLMQ